MSLKQLIASTFYEKSSGGGGGGSVPSGGLTGNALVKNSNTDFDTKWLEVSTVGTALMVLTNPGAITFLRVNADNSVTALSAADFKTALSIAAGIDGSTGSVGDVVLVANGTGGSTLKAVANTTITPGQLYYSGGDFIIKCHYDTYIKDDVGNTYAAFTSASTFLNAPIQLMNSVRLSATMDGAFEGHLTIGSFYSLGATLKFIDISTLGSVSGGGLIGSLSGKMSAVDPSGNTTSFCPDFVCKTSGFGLQLQSGTGQRAGNATLVGGTVTVTNTTVTANTLVILCEKTAGGTLGSYSYTLSAGASFTINSSSAIDTSTLTYFLIELN